MNSYSKRIGDYLIVRIRNSGWKVIAEVTREDPLTIKIGEESKYCDLGSEEFEILEEESAQFQNDNTRTELLLKNEKAKNAIVYGLKSLGINDGCFYKILSANKNIN